MGWFQVRAQRPAACATSSSAHAAANPTRGAGPKRPGHTGGAFLFNGQARFDAIGDCAPKLLQRPQPGKWKEQPRKWKSDYYRRGNARGFGGGGKTPRKTEQPESPGRGARA